MPLIFLPITPSPSSIPLFAFLLSLFFYFPLLRFRLPPSFLSSFSPFLRFPSPLFPPVSVFPFSFLPRFFLPFQPSPIIITKLVIKKFFCFFFFNTLVNCSYEYSSLFFCILRIDNFPINRHIILRRSFV